MYSLLSDFGDKNFCSVATIIADRQGEILNYFINRATNASAESLNAKIKHFRAQLHGVVDVKFFLFWLTKLLQKSEMRKVIVIELSYKGFS